MNPGRAFLGCSVAVSMLMVLPLFAATGDRAPVCASCHPKETAAYLKSQMGNSIAPPTSIAGGHITHKGSGIEISILEREGRMVHSLSTNGLTAEYPVAYQVGAGKVGYTYMVKIGDYLFESPASWYRQHGWDVSPGYQYMATVDFDRPVDSACMFCHASNAKFAGSDGRRLAGTLTAIGCERCHGPTDEHVRQPSAKNIINPSKLPQRARNSICEQCHLEGETRLLNPGKNWPDFHPGDEFERTAAVYLLAENAHGVRAVGQVEQLAQSQCVRASGGKLWCGTCHSPHKEVANRQSQIREVCVSCHTTLSKAAHPAAATDCVGCHMPRLTPEDIPHAASTDHRILRRPAPLPKAENSNAGISVWQEPPEPFRARDLAVASLIIGGTHGITPLRDEGVKLVEALPENIKESDPAVLSALISVRLQRREPEKALPFARRATEVQPDSGFASLSLSIVLENSSDEAAAEKQLLHTIDIDPALQAAWVNLAFLYQRQGRQADRTALLDRYLRWNPQSIWFRQLKAMEPERR